MILLGNIIWFLFGGAFMGLAWAVAGILWSVTIIGIPAGRQCFKIAALCFFPFGKKVLPPSGGTGNFILNLLWVIITGLPMAIAAVLLGIAFCCTIIGIPFGLQYFKIASLSLTPFGAIIV